MCAHVSTVCARMRARARARAQPASAHSTTQPGDFARQQQKHTGQRTPEPHARMCHPPCLLVREAGEASAIWPRLRRPISTASRPAVAFAAVPRHTRSLGLVVPTVPAAHSSSKGEMWPDSAPARWLSCSGRAEVLRAFLFPCGRLPVGRPSRRDDAQRVRSRVWRVSFCARASAFAGGDVRVAPEYEHLA